MRMKSLEISDPSEFAKWILQKRKRCGISQAALSRASTVSTRTIVALENARVQSIRTDVLVRLAKVLRIPPEEITGKAGKEHLEAIKVWEESGGTLEDLRSPGPIVLDRPLSKDDLQFLLEMRDRFNNFTLAFAVALLERRRS